MTLKFYTMILLDSYVPTGHFPQIKSLLSFVWKLYSEAEGVCHKIIYWSQESALILRGRKKIFMFVSVFQVLAPVVADGRFSTIISCEMSNRMKI